MSASKKNSKKQWVDPDDAPEWTAEMFEHAEIAIGGVVIRPATGTLTKTGVGRPKSAAPKQAVSLRLSPEVIAHFKAGGPGWQTRIDEALRKLVGLA